MDKKKCNNCGKIKSINEFWEGKGYKNGYMARCKDCIKQWYKNNKDKVNQYKKGWAKSNPEKIKKAREKYQNNNIEKIRRRASQWQKDNKERVNKKNRIWKSKNRRKIYLIPKNKLNIAMSNGIFKSLKRNKRGYQWENLIGYTIKDLKAHLKKNFKKGMTFNNYGKWHIDHIIPISLWDFNSYKDREFKQCWALTNLQPLWADEHLLKGNKICDY